MSDTLKINSDPFFMAHQPSKVFRERAEPLPGVRAIFNGMRLPVEELNEAKSTGKNMTIKPRPSFITPTDWNFVWASSLLCKYLIYGK